MVFKSQHEDADIPHNVSLTEFLLSRIDPKYGDEPYIVDSVTEQSLSFNRTKQLITNVATNLQKEYNVKKADVVGILMPNLILYPVAFHGVVLAGGVSTTINPLYSEEEVQRQLQSSGATLLITIQPLLEKSSKALAGTKVSKIFVIAEGDVKEEGNVLDFKKRLMCPSKQTLTKVSIQDDDLVCLPFSSGTTGLNKGVMLTHRNVISNCIQIQQVDKYTRQDAIVGFLPFFHIYGQVVIMNMGLFNNIKVVCITQFNFVEFLKAIEKHHVTRVHVVPPVILAMAKEPVVKKFNLSHVKIITSGAAPLSEGLANLASRAMNIPVVQGYGMTESSPVTTMSTDKYNRPGSIGLIMPNCEMKIVNTDDRKTELGYNQEGELCFRGPNIMLGYLNNKEATDDTIRDGWLHTGDIGYIDEDGYSYIVDRLKELIKYKGFQVPPAELEGLLLKHESVQDCAVVGVPEPGVGELPKACVVRKKGYENVTEQQLMDYVAKHVNPQKRIRIVQFVEAIPKSATGKILRRLLKESPASKL
ncbi:4-coumarate-CoA ligase [Acrasis kona]|uniref:4-coumarate-CoA ligase n=1 Tax=Acrasis kona TaxID=1008807 RepID=A0AAW2ZST2_9EUKA